MSTAEFVVNGWAWLVDFLNSPYALAAFGVWLFLLMTGVDKWAVRRWQRRFPRRSSRQDRLVPIIERIADILEEQNRVPNSQTVTDKLGNLRSLIAQLGD